MLEQTPLIYNVKLPVLMNIFYAEIVLSQFPFVCLWVSNLIAEVPSYGTIILFHFQNRLQGSLFIIA